MSRSGYSEDCDDEYNSSNLWRGALIRAIQGRRGQAFLREMATALDAMPIKELIADAIVRDDGQVCAIGAVAVARKVDVAGLDAEDSDAVAKAFGVAPCLAREIAFQNDDDFEYLGPRGETPAARWSRIRGWVASQLTQTEATP